MLTVEQRIEIERKVIAFLYAAMLKGGWTVAHVWDGEESVKCHSEEDVLDTVFSVDESAIIFKKTVRGVTLRRTAQIILGNDGYDCIADHSLSTEDEDDNFLQVMEQEVEPFCESLAAPERLRFQWNTGRGYSALGQRVIAEVVAEGIVFHDLDRNIHGLIQIGTLPQVMDKHKLRELTMAMYDACGYGWDPQDRASKLKWED